MKPFATSESHLTCMHAHKHTHARNHTCMHAHKHTHARKHACMHAHKHTHARKHTCMLAHKHTHARNHTHACVHTRTHSCVSDSSFPFLYATDPQWSIIFYLLFFSATDIFQSMKAKPKKKEGRRRKGQVSTVFYQFGNQSYNLLIVFTLSFFLLTEATQSRRSLRRND